MTHEDQFVKVKYETTKLKTQNCDSGVQKKSLSDWTFTWPSSHS